MLGFMKTILFIILVVLLVLLGIPAVRYFYLTFCEHPFSWPNAQDDNPIKTDVEKACRSPGPKKEEGMEIKEKEIAKKRLTFSEIDAMLDTIKFKEL